MLSDSENDSAKGVLKAKLEQVEEEILLEALRSTRGNRAQAAKVLGITERIIGLRIKKYRINCRQFRTRM
jgi:Nif-specific regulatory protein